MKSQKFYAFAGLALGLLSLQSAALAGNGPGIDTITDTMEITLKPSSRASDASSQKRQYAAVKTEASYVAQNPQAVPSAALMEVITAVKEDVALNMGQEASDRLSQQAIAKFIFAKAIEMEQVAE